ncbi:hypothetical protein [Nostoc sp. PA-18-2419]|uniref:hypothetical protein n=1 Tax=Nostoc sp. PA-18-2419 TaxID=2575443 RepID=UPI0011098270|nr:hypothetical protein [Nostoc sp. PA-18-2419]
MSLNDLTPADNLPDQIVYVLLDKIKHDEEGQRDVSFFAEDFEGKQVNPEELLELLNRLKQSGYFTGEIESNKANSESGSSTPLVTCKNAEITTEGRAMLKSIFFKPV